MVRFHARGQLNLNMLTLDTPIEKIRYVGPRNIPRLKNLGIKTVKNLLWHFPSRYEDFSTIIPIADLKSKDVANIHGEVVHIENLRLWKRRMHITTAVIKDETDTIRAVWFNQPFVENYIKEGSMISIAGKVSVDKKGLYFSSPTYEKIQSAPTHTGRLVPVYPETKGVTSKYLRLLVKQSLSKIPQIKECLSEEILNKHLLPSIDNALNQIHFPSSIENASMAKNRFAFEELLLFQLKALQSRRSLMKLSAPKIQFKEELIKSFVGSLPFELTSDQKISAFEILKDLERPFPMNRLLNGDVGSGKTVVALISAYQTIRAGHQVAFMVPTEILARQHFETIKEIIKDSDIKIELLTASTKNKKEIAKQISNGLISLVIGTHALIQKNVKFKNLGLVVIDEQHRFGVEQRMKLVKGSSKESGGLVPHLLSMTATPIPRTLALTVYGDLDISLIKEKPKGRQAIITKVIPSLEKKLTYKFLDSEIEKGRQIFLVCPRIELSDPKEGIKTSARQSKMNVLWQEVKAVTEEYKRISKEVFPHRKIAMIHGKMKPKEKEEIMEKFKEGDYDVLVSTSVIEVGVDIPNATVMAIENAERFGLAQLHQFRGRVGRGKDQSHCLLFCGTDQNAENKRLKILAESDDGFYLAEKDLEIRGPGHFFGTQQSGMPDFSMASLANVELIKKARQEAKLLLKKDPVLEEYPDLRQKLQEFQIIRHFE